MTAGRIFYSAWSRNDTDTGDAKWTSSIMNWDIADNCTEFSWDGDYPYNVMTTDEDSGLTLPGHEMQLPKIRTQWLRRTLLKAGTYWVSTMQEELHQQSCWATISQKLGAPNPTSAPSTVIPSGFANITWVVMADRRSVELCIDRTGSMSGYKMDQAKEGAKLFANLAQVASGDDAGDRIGVVSFNTSATTTAPIRELTDQAKKDQILAAIDTLSATGGTSIGAGLKLSGDQIKSVGSVGAGEMIVLLSDGEENTAPMVASTLPAIISRGIKVYTISLGSGAKLPLMQSIADQTSGKHYVISDAADLQAAYAKIDQQVKEATTASSARSVLAPGAELAYGVNVNPGVPEVTFVITSDAPGLGLRLSSPSGAVMDQDNHDENVEFIVSGTNWIIKVHEPAPGIWTPLIAAPAAADAFTFAKAVVPPARIPDGSNALKSTIRVTRGAMIDSIYPSLSIAHQYVGDLKVTLKSPKGTSVVLHDHSGGGGESIQGTYGEDLTPANPLSAFIGQQMKGDWQLVVVDTGAGDTGTLSSWGLTFNADDPKSVASFELLTSFRGDSVMYQAGIDSTKVSYPTPVVLHANVYAGGPVSGAAVTAVITHPDGETQSVVQLYDDGNGENGDTQGGDGIYSTAFAGFTQNGTYQAVIGVDSSKGFISFAGNAYNPDPPPPVPAPQFTREDSVGFSVSGVPDPKVNAVQVKKFALAKNSVNTGGFTISGLFNADSWQYDPKTDPVSFALDGYTLGLTAAQLTQKGRKFRYEYVSADKKLRRTVAIVPYIGGSSKCSYSVTVKNDNLGGITYAESTPQINFSFSGGSITDNATLLVDTAVSAKGSSASYRAGSSGEVSPALYVQTASVKLRPKKTNRDLLQLLGWLPGWVLPKTWFDGEVVVDFGGLSYHAPAGSLKKQRNGSYKASLDGGNITLQYHPEKRLLKLTGKNQNLRSFSNPAMVGITIAGKTQVARVLMTYKPKGTTYTY